MLGQKQDTKYSYVVSVFFLHIIEASIARPPLEADGNFSIIITILIIHVVGIWLPGYPREKVCGCSAAMKRVWLSAACTIYRSPLSSAACCTAIASSARPTMLCILLVLGEGEREAWGRGYRFNTQFVSCVLCITQIMS